MQIVWQPRDITPGRRARVVADDLGLVELLICGLPTDNDSPERFFAVVVSANKAGTVQIRETIRPSEISNWLNEHAALPVELPPEIVPLFDCWPKKDVVK